MCIVHHEPFKLAVSLTNLCYPINCNAHKYVLPNKLQRSQICVTQ